MSTFTPYLQYRRRQWRRQKSAAQLLRARYRQFTIVGGVTSSKNYNVSHHLLAYPVPNNISGATYVMEPQITERGSLT